MISELLSSLVILSRLLSYDGWENGRLKIRNS